MCPQDSNVLGVGASYSSSCSSCELVFDWTDAVGKGGKPSNQLQNDEYHESTSSKLSFKTPVAGSEGHCVRPKGEEQRQHILLDHEAHEPTKRDTPHGRSTSHKQPVRDNEGLEAAFTNDRSRIGPIGATSNGVRIPMYVADD